MIGKPIHLSKTKTGITSKDDVDVDYEDDDGTDVENYGSTFLSRFVEGLNIDEERELLADGLSFTINGVSMPAERGSLSDDLLKMAQGMVKAHRGQGNQRRKGKPFEYQMPQSIKTSMMGKFRLIADYPVEFWIVGILALPYSATTVRKWIKKRLEDAELEASDLTDMSPGEQSELLLGYNIPNSKAGMLELRKIAATGGISDNIIDAAISALLPF